MCPTLESILSRSLMRGKFPISNRGTASSSSSTSASFGGGGGAATSLHLSPVPSLKVPTLKSPHQQQQQQQQQQNQQKDSETSTNSNNNNKKTSSSSSPVSSSSSSSSSPFITAFSGLGAPSYEPDTRPQIKERPERKGVRSLQDLQSLLNSACALGEWKSALSGIKEGFELVLENNNNNNNNNNSNNVNKNSNDNNNNTSPSSSSTSSYSSLRQSFPVDELAAVASCCKSATRSTSAFETSMDEVLLVRNLPVSLQVEWRDMTTEALVKSGSWIAALERFERLSQVEEKKEEGNDEQQEETERISVASLNACISGLAGGKQWQAALKLAVPSIEERAKRDLARFTGKNNSDSNQNKSEEAKQEQGEEGDVVTGKKNNNEQQEDVTEKDLPLSHFGTSSSENTSSTSNSDILPRRRRVPAANAVTYATLVSTLESCGRSTEAQQILASAPHSERDAVLASYVALLQVWSNSHYKKSMRRFGKN